MLITNGHADKNYGSLGPRASLLRAHSLDVSLRLTDLELEDDGSYQCELINGIEDENVIITLRVEGTVRTTYHNTLLKNDTETLT